MLKGQDVTKVAEVLGGTAILGRSVEDWDDLLQVAKSGMPEAVLGALLSRISMNSGHDMAEELTALMRGAGESGEPRTHLTVVAGLSAIRIASLFVIVLESFGDEINVSTFFTTPHPELGGQMPITVAVSDAGAVEEIIMRGNLGA